MKRIYYVDAGSPSEGNGTKESPFRTIQSAAEIAKPGDQVLVSPGIYRERVDPKHGGTKDDPIVYKSVEPLSAVITGAEPLGNWKKDGEIWTARVSDSVFKEYNPYTTYVAGDWLNGAVKAHTGDVMLNGKSMYEVASREELINSPWTKYSWDRDGAAYTWYAEQDIPAGETVFYAYFRDKDPNKECTEITVRPTCFAPEKENIDYITISGFTVCEAATQWAPPTAYQEGMIAPHWSKGWIIEDCEIFESKCSGISLGKYYQKDNNNKWLQWKYKDGTQTQRECVCLAQADGWTKETAGGHTVRRCDIHDCGQTGIVGHMGCAFSLIEDNHIHHINNKQNLDGAEIGGIKFHAAIDTIIRRNHIHHCTRGLWLDWEAQGTRVSQCFMHHNTAPFLEKMPDAGTGEDPLRGIGEDLFIEVSHGPTLVDNNIFLSDRALKLPCQGAAFVNNLIAGGIVSVGIGTDNGGRNLPTPRYTPYHFPHRTEIAGFMTILHGDMRFYNNIFLQNEVRAPMRDIMEYISENKNIWDDGNVISGTFVYNGYPEFEEWNRQFAGYCGMGADVGDLYYDHLPVWTGGNIFLGGARMWEKERDYSCVDDCAVYAYAVQKSDGWYIHTNIGELIPLTENPVIDTEILGIAFEPEQKFEDPDGTELSLDRDFFGNKCARARYAGPLADPNDYSCRIGG